MTDSEQHPYIELIAHEARRPVVTDPAARQRIMAAVRAMPAPSRPWRFLTGVLQPRPLLLSPVAGALLAAGLVGVGALGGTFVNNRDVRLPGEHPKDVVAQQLPVSDTVVKFVFVAPQASHVSLVGDFNEWDAGKTRMVRLPGSGLWTATLSLPAGRHLYAFVVDGTWSPDPNAPLAPDDGFGHTNSVKLVRGGPAL